MSKVLTVEQREQAGSDSYNRFEYQVHWIVCHIIVVYNFVLVERNLLLFVIPYIIIIYSLRKEVDIMDYISVKAASEKWGISERRIQKLCEENRIDGTEKFGRAWMIPKDAEKPVDGRMKTRNKQEENHGI